MAVTPRLSASVILARDARDADGQPRLEVFMLLRHERSHTLPSIYVFAGGTVSDDDRVTAQAWGGAAEELAGRINARSDVAVDAELAATVHACAVRELYEEAGVLLARGVRGDGLVRLDALSAATTEALRQDRTRLQEGQRSLLDLLDEQRWLPAFDALVPFSHWVTPEGVAARFETWFFTCGMPEGQEAIHCEIETSDGVWLTPEDALERAARGTHRVIFPTENHLRRLVPFTSVAALEQFAREKAIRRVQPVVTFGAGGEVLDTRILAQQLVDAW